MNPVLGRVRSTNVPSSFNLCDLPPWVIASREYNENPEPFEVQGVRRANRFLFAKLDTIDDPRARGEVFNDYMSVKFYLHELDTESDKARRSIKNSYLRFLRGWGVDSNSVEGAVLKGWVESRIGIPPTFHKERIRGASHEDSMTYVTDRMRGSAFTNAINSQLDVLYEFCQYELRRRGNDRFFKLFRGTYDLSEHQVLETTGKREYVVKLNNLFSCTNDRERAWEFGTTVWQITVPASKVFFFTDLLPNSILKGEGEYIVIGGDYRVKQLLA